ncbi:MAG: ChaB family protein [Steroidobacteraceae bacterium]
MRGFAHRKVSREYTMPYGANEELPESVRAHLPAHAQDIFRESFNSAWHSYGVSQPQDREQRAFRVAWAAVKRRYHKVGDSWIET